MDSSQPPIVVVKIHGEWKYRGITGDGWSDLELLRTDVDWKPIWLMQKGETKKETVEEFLVKQTIEQTQLLAKMEKHLSRLRELSTFVSA